VDISKTIYQEESRISETGQNTKQDDHFG